ncbi:arginyltransferase [Entomobacter blattae]|uniref:Aspartate/glutamate leucyltransferase n=1 Tax=Entomobacter blattae TaxID=2762277 RepID=A0A7H1NT10_9PROT|nr:arginyltransferase [Entomobacter blattae]QNT78920.1 Aspartate/glutamate leucyltransferase [Entomobacter blattae]
MNTYFLLYTRQFYTTLPAPCPYLPGQVERKIITDLSGHDSILLNNHFSQAGFRRSHTITYAPACPKCNLCLSLRIKTQEFLAHRTHRKILKKGNRFLSCHIRVPQATDEQYQLFLAYQNYRHQQGEMAVMTYLEYQSMIEDSPVHTYVAEFRDSHNILVAVSLFDELEDGFSAVYNFFVPEYSDCSLGTYMILWLIELTKGQYLPYTYLGYWVPYSSKMSYKDSFQPYEVYLQGKWQNESKGKILSIIEEEKNTLL